MRESGFQEQRVAENLQFEERPARADWSDAQQAAVIEELNFILTHPAFKGSHRCVELLRYLVHQAAAGDEEWIKERTLGVEVFGRSANYDVNADPIVRRTANEIRKRLAQCYLETDRPHAVRIHLERGSYRPEFKFAREESLPEATPAKAPLHPPDGMAPQRQQTVPPGGTSGILRHKWMLGIAAALLAAAAGILSIRYDAFRSSQYMVWKPLLDTGDRLAICLSDQTALVNDDVKAGSQAVNKAAVSSQAVPPPDNKRFFSDTPFADARVAHQISTLLQGYKGNTSLQKCTALTFQDLRRQPAVFIGGSNNPWTPILLSGLRYSIRIDPGTRDKWIQDAQNPSNRDWRIEGKLQNTDSSPDYAVITRFLNKETGQWIMALSGLEAHGTEAAGELVADPAFAKSLPSAVRSGKNFQIVLKTSVIRGSTGPFEILAVHAW